ncbi:MAG: helix-turn-helix transcriptional regulator [Clostridia bacterium]|nr:helix-turn-helix transcriptional regulator [Clostridia bacterium]
MIKIDYKDLGKRVRELRRASDLTQEELAEQCGISASFLGHIERGTRVASIETLVCICNTLRVTPQYLLSASLHTFDDHMPEGISAENRARLSEFLRLAQDTLANWNE